MIIDQQSIPNQNNFSDSTVKSGIVKSSLEKNCFHKIILFKDAMSVLGVGRYGQQPIRYVFDTDLADTIRIRYDIHVHDFKISKVSKSIILDFNNKVNVWGDLSIESNKYECKCKIITCVVFTIVLFTKYLVQHNHDQTQYA